MEVMVHYISTTEQYGVHPGKNTNRLFYSSSIQTIFLDFSKAFDIINLVQVLFKKKCMAFVNRLQS